MFKNKTIVITGGTGSFGNEAINHLLKLPIKQIKIFSRDEMKQWNMSSKYQDKRIKYVIGDVRDLSSLDQAFNDADYVIHAAATKIVPTAEYNPKECILTNINGAINVIEAAKRNGVKKVVALSTDKASNPINLYGASKLCSDKLFVAANFTSNKTKCSFSIVRYGNVMGSRGSVIPFFLEQKKKGFFTITHKDMTRFMITLDQAVKMVLEGFRDALGGEIYISKIPSMKVIDIARSINEKNQLKLIGIRPGEKMHEQMIGLEDSRFTYEYSKYYKILPAIFDLYKNKKYRKNGKKVDSNFSYSSDNNKQWMKKSELKKWLSKNID